MRDRADFALTWWHWVRARNNDAFLPLLFDEHRYLVLRGGGGSGKSIFCGFKLIERCTTEPGHRFLVVRKVARTLRESCFRQLTGQALDLHPEALDRISRGEMRISFRNGSEILFAGLDDAEKLKSIYNITGIWIEEASELLEGDFNQLDIRLRGETRFYKQIMLSFNPISITHWLKKRFFDQSDSRAQIHNSVYHDNRFLDEESKKTLEGFREADPYYYMVYCLNQWGVTGKTVFNARILSERLARLPQPLRVGQFVPRMAADGVHILSWTWEEDQDGCVTIYLEPGQGAPYVIGGDTAGDGSDWFVGQVLDNTNGRQAAVLRHQMDEDQYARQMYCLGMYYNQALLGIETNFSTYPVKLLEKMGYKNQFVREIEDQFDGNVRHAFGFQTNKLTRGIIIPELKQIVRESPETLNDRTTIEEMMTFVLTDRMRPEAEPGAHDDCVMALAIAHYIRPQQRTCVDRQEQDRDWWTADMWEDYRQANAEGKAYLREKWKRPT